VLIEKSGNRIERIEEEMRIEIGAKLPEPRLCDLRGEPCFSA
jgi:hypothetical protein